MNEKLFTEMTGKRPRTAAENAKHYAEQDKAFRLRLSTLPATEARDVCKRLLAIDGMAGTVSGRTAAEWLAKAT